MDSKMEGWEYIELRFSADERYIYIYPEDKIDTLKIKQAFKKFPEFKIEKVDDGAFLDFGYNNATRSGFIVTLNILGHNGWDAFSVSDSEKCQSVFLKRRIEK